MGLIKDACSRLDVIKNESLNIDELDNYLKTYHSEQVFLSEVKTRGISIFLFHIINSTMKPQSEVCEALIKSEKPPVESCGKVGGLEFHMDASSAPTLHLIPNKQHKEVSL